MTETLVILSFVCTYRVPSSFPPSELELECWFTIDDHRSYLYLILDVISFPVVIFHFDGMTDTRCSFDLSPPKDPRTHACTQTFIHACTQIHKYTSTHRCAFIYMYI